MEQKIVLRKRLEEFERRQKECRGNYTGTIINLKRRIQEINDNQSNKKKSKGNIELIIITLLFIICISTLSILLYKEIKTPILDHNEVITYFENGAKCLGYRTGSWNRDIKDARKVKMEYNGKTSWFYTDFDTAREVWDKYQK